MFSGAPSDVLYSMSEWEPSSNTIVRFGVEVIETRKCQAADFMEGEQKYYQRYCQQGILLGCDIALSSDEVP